MLSKIDTAKRGQQEMVGFVLIVVLVVVGLLVFLVVSLRQEPKETDSLEVGNMLSGIMRHTTECAIVFEPQYDTFEDLLKSYHEGDRCTNLDKSAEEYLNESLTSLLGDIMDTEATIKAYQLEVVIRDDVGEQGLFRMFSGNCTGGELSGASRSIISGADTLLVKLKVCRSFD
jgi:hypothetical protein